jgi:pullulanase/glycogen debranching enzyme
MWPGSPYPLGAAFDGGGTNFAIFSEVAERIELCLFSDTGEETRADLPERNGLMNGTKRCSPTALMTRTPSTTPTRPPTR